MAYRLVQRYGPKDHPLFRKESFSLEPLAVIRAAQYYTAGSNGDFRIEDDRGRIIADDREIRQRCKTTRMP
jgi:hypothetical protein